MLAGKNYGIITNKRRDYLYMRDLYIGLMSGTSADGIDVALVDFSKAKLEVLATHYVPYPSLLREKILSLSEKGENDIPRLGELDAILGKEFAAAIKALLEKRSIYPKDIKAIGSHGQTIRHHPHLPHKYSLQIGDPNIIAAETDITTVADFRRKDIALGGQGAPLVPAFHQHMFADRDVSRAVVNIGGIANITILPKDNDDAILGYDTGPGNTLMDAWIHLRQNKRLDENGEWAASGAIHTDLLSQLLTDPYFSLPPPKSTGRELFNLDWLQQHLWTIDISPADVQATLTELTARTIINEVRKHLSNGEILICGGGARNTYLMTRLTELAKPDFELASTQLHGIDPDWVEAIAFAWLARQTMHHLPGNMPQVTGAKAATILGGVYFAT